MRCVLRAVYATFPRKHNHIIYRTIIHTERGRGGGGDGLIASSFVSPQETYITLYYYCCVYRRNKIKYGIYMCTHTVRTYNNNNILYKRPHTHYVPDICARINSRQTILSCLPTKGLTCSGMG